MFTDLLSSKRPDTSYTSELIDTLRLIRSENVGVRTFFALIQLFGSASKAIENAQEFSVRGGRSYG